MKRVSVIVPSYKPGKYVFDCLESLMSQTLDDDLYEVIVVLNGIKDPYYKNLTDYSLRYNNLHVFYEEVVGVSNARNTGMKYAIGEYYAFVDDDDIISSNYLEELLKVATPTIMGVSNIHSFRESVENYGDDFFACRIVQKRRNPNSLFFNRAILSIPVAKLIHREMIDSRFFDPRFRNGEDALFITQISDKVSGFAFTDPSASYFVRMRNGSATRHKFTIKELSVNAFMLLKAYIKIYLSSPLSYNLLLFLSRVPGLIKGNFALWINNK